MSRKITASVLSDNHHEHKTHYISPERYAEGGAQLAILAGDVDEPEAALAYCAQIGIPAIYLLGNHEFYGRDYPETRKAAAALAETLPDVHLLDPGVVQLDLDGSPIRVIGATLWTDYRLFGAGDEWRAMKAAREQMNDHRLIRNGLDRFMPDDAQAAHIKERAFIEEQLATPFDGPTLVVTHHAPSMRCQDAKYANSPIAPAFCSDLEHLVADSGAALWISGHTHGDCDLMLGETRLVSNQHGYRGEKTVGIKLIDIPVDDG